jgi:hypothetical protein
MQPPMQPYRLTCDRAPMSADLGPPDFWPLEPVRRARGGRGPASRERGRRAGPLQLRRRTARRPRSVRALPLPQPPQPTPPPRAHAPAPQGGCPEDRLDAATLVHGYKWGADAFRITDANESLLSLTCHATYWDPRNVAALRQVRALRDGAAVARGRAGSVIPVARRAGAAAAAAR